MKILGLAAIGTALLFGTAHAQRPGPDTLVVAQTTDPDSLDPAQIRSRDASNIAQHVFATLYEVDREGNLSPYLAESYAISDSGTEISFKLRSGLTCDDGSKLSAQDVAYSFQRAADPANRFTGNTPGFVLDAVHYKGVRVDDDLNVTILTNEYSPIAVGLLAETFIHCKAPYEKMTLARAAQTMVGSGPYRFVRWDRNDKVVLERVEGFKLRPAPFKTIVWRDIPEASTRATELLAGNVDIITNLSPDQIGRVNASAAAKSATVPGTRRIFVGFNQKPEFAKTLGGAAIQKVEVRHALQYAVDVPTICANLLQSPCRRATGLVNPPNDNKSLTPTPYDPAMAEKLLDEAGYKRGKDGIRFSLTLQGPRDRYINDTNIELAIGQYLSDIGVETKVEPMEFASTYSPLIRLHNAGPLFLLGSGGGTWSALYDMADIVAPNGGTNYTEWNDPEWFDGWKKINASRDPVAQKAIIDNMQRVFYERGPWLLLYFQPNYYAVSTKLDWAPRSDEMIYLYDAKRK